MMLSFALQSTIQPTILFHFIFALMGKFESCAFLGLI